MERRMFLAVVGSTIAASLGGCTGSQGGDGGCAPPDTDDLTGLLPAGSDRFQLDSDRGRQGNQATAFYTDGNGNRYLYSVFKLESESAAEAKTDELGGVGGVTLGYVQLGRYIFSVSTQDGGREAVEDLLAESSAISDDCVTDAVEYA